MNTAFANRLSAFASAAFLTVVMLAGVNGLATSELAPAQLAHLSAPLQA